MRSAELTVPAARGGALRLPAGAAWSGSRSSTASGIAGRPAIMCSSRLVVQVAAGGKRAPSDPLSRPPRGAARLHHTSQPMRLEGANHIVPAPQHGPLPVELDHQQAQPASSSARNGSSSTPAAPAAAERTADRTAVASAGTASRPATPAGRINWTDGRTASQLAGLHRPAGLVVGSAWLLAVSLELSGEGQQACWCPPACPPSTHSFLPTWPSAARLMVSGARMTKQLLTVKPPVPPPFPPPGVSGVTPAWLPVLAGGALGGLAAAAHHAAVRHVWRLPARPLRVVITGGSCGIGKALAREFLKCAVAEPAAAPQLSCGGVC